MKNKWTIWMSSIFDAEKKVWKNEYVFYLASGIADNTDPKSDWRFCEVKGKRKQLDLLGMVILGDDDFPIRYPLKLDNGFVVQGIE